MLVAWAIPDVPRKLADRIKREDYLTREIIIEQEKIRSRASVPNTPVPQHLQNGLYRNGNNDDTSDIRRRKGNGDVIESFDF